MDKIRIKGEYQEIFKSMIQELRNRVNLIAFIIFGSRARGDYLPYSDFDVLIVADFKEKYISRGEWIVQIAPDVAIDIFTYTPNEFENLFNSYNLTAIDSIGEGIVLVGDNFYKKYKKKFEFFIANGMKKDTKLQILIPPNL
ncbi:MAG: nucleotidyltransferase domain-containing protein [Promethearchaeota archaeon]